MAAALASASCGGSPRASRGDVERTPFDCHDRWVSYLLVGSLAGEEVGVAIDCAESGPRLRRWVVDGSGNRDERGRSMTAHEFDDIWNRIDGTGWRFLRDCEPKDTGQPKASAKGKRNAKKARARASDPIYTFDVKDWNGRVSFSCAGRGALPFPYGSIVDELDQAAGPLRDAPGQGGGPRPADGRGDDDNDDLGEDT